MHPPKSPVEEIGPVVIDRKDEVWLAGDAWSWTTANHGEGVLSHRFTLERRGKFVHFFLLGWKTWGEAENMARQAKAELEDKPIN